MAEKKYELIKESKITESREIGTDLSHLTKYNEYDKDRGEYVSYYKPEDIRKERKKLKEKRKALKKDECEYEDIFNTSNFVKPKLLEETYNLYRIRALKDFGDVKAGDLGGYIESERNLSQEGNCWVSDEAKVYDNALVFGKTEVYDNAQIYGYAQVYGNAKVFEYTGISDDTKIIDNTIIENSKEIKVENVKKDFILENDFNLENEIQKYEEHCSEIVDKLKLQDELPNFQVISQKGVLYEKNSENNNITEIKNFVENLKGEEFWDNMSLKDIRNWKELRNDEVVSIVYESKDDRDNITLEEFTDYNDYAKDTVINALSKEYAKNPDTIESLRKDILDKVPNKEVVKEKVEVVKDIEKEHLEKEEKVTNKTFGYRSDF